MSSSEFQNNGPPPPYSPTERSPNYGSSRNLYQGSVTRPGASMITNVTFVSQRTPLLPRSSATSNHTKLRLMFRFMLITGIFFVGMITFYSFERFFAVPTSWINLTPSPECTSIGARTYTGILSYMPEGYHPYVFCSFIPVTIHGRKIPRPLSCYSEPFEREVDSPPRNVTHTITRGKWLVDFGEGSCIPTWDPLPSGVPNPTPDPGCHSYRIRGYTAFMSLSRIPPGLDPLHSCRNTPAVINGHRVLPEQCQLEQISNGEILRARFMVEEPSCTPVWTDVRPDYQCARYGVKRFYGSLAGIKELDGLKVCREVPYAFFGKEMRKPDSCERDGSGGIRGIWEIDFNVPECHPILRDLRDKGCAGTRNKRVEAQVVDIGKHEDWYRMCTTTPLRWDGVVYYPTQCESRTIWFFNYKVALYDIYDPSCR
ncbi:hypothetical protein E1B28_003517 [Marasmius oreades]|uniref:Uncharacterized protein n=1 Tax=Marasmius oreades TaxID=181124 RepID=A0A9P7RLS7_9AGAR|nr:uncharacterized protein E1B28_003517 [Marasmius oreades]KAG7085994.1 hypothetical protein E1B28_003517 [Marasmius oreades]